jgi:CheY-like chemotaxis protein
MIEQKLIVVDDDKITHFILKKMFERNQFFQSPIFFEKATDAVSFLKEDYKSSERYLIFLDINMPVMNGWQFLDEVSNLFSNSNLSVVMISSSSDEIDAIKASKDKFVIHFITKPLTNDDLLVIKEKCKNAI